MTSWTLAKGYVLGQLLSAAVSIGILLAFAAVCAGVLGVKELMEWIQRRRKKRQKAK